MPSLQSPPIAESPRPVVPASVDYARLKRRIQEAGLLRKQPWYYALSISTNMAMLVCVLLVMVAVNNPWVRVLDAVAFGWVSGQLGFQLHDAGHRQMFAHGWLNTLVGFLTADGLLGMSYGWWTSKHNRHHANPNNVDEDPDIGPGAIAYTPEQARARRGLLRMLTAYQAYFFFPLLPLLGFSMHMSGIEYLVKSRSRLRWLEIAALCVHTALYVGLLVFFLGPWIALVVIVVHKASGGFYMATVFAPNHKGMPQVPGGTRLDFLRSQVLTARNVRSGRATNLWYGSLNYQIEHHLFPAMPRNHLPRAQKIVKAYCAEIGVPYYEASVWRSYRELLGFLHEIGRPLRTRPIAA